MINGVIYARYSSHAQREESIEEQIRICQEFASKNDIVITRTYSDSAMTGTNDDRPAFREMIEDAKNKLFECIVMYGIDRFSRNKYDFYAHKQKLAKLGVSLRFVTQDFNDDPEGELSESFFVAIADYYSKNLSRNVKRGMEHNAMTGKVTGKCSFGYCNKDGFIAIDPVKAPIVREIFDRYVHGQTMQQIMDWLNDNGFRTSFHKPFTKNSLASMLTNEKYIGIFDWGGYHSDRPDLAIIDQDTWDTVQRVRRSRNHLIRGVKITDPYILSRKMVCGLCGSSVVGESAKSGEYKYYTCRKCGVRVPKEDVERAFRESVWTDILTDEMIESIAERALELDRTLQRGTGIELYREQLKDAEKRLENIMRAIEKGLDANDFSARITELKRNIAELKMRISEIDNQPQITKEMIVGFLNEHRQGYRDITNFEFTLVEGIVGLVELFRHEIVIHYNLIRENDRLLILRNYDWKSKKSSSESSMVDYGTGNTNYIKDLRYIVKRPL